MKIKILINEWVDWLKEEKRLSTNTILAYKRDLSSLSNFLIIYFNKDFDFLLFEMVDHKTIRSWFYERLKNKVSSRSNARALSSIKSFYLYLIKRKIIQKSEITSIDTPKFVESIPRPLSYEQMKKIINFFKQKNKTWISKRNISIIFLMWGLGMRINEVINLKKSDIQGSNWLIIKGKGNKERLLPIYDEIRNFILDMISETPFTIGDKNFIFVGEKGKKIHPTIIQKEVREVRKALDLPENTTPHSFRHTFATQLLDNMVDLRSIQELLGHDSLSSTQKYTNVNSKKIKRVIDIYHPRSSDDL